MNSIKDLFENGLTYSQYLNTGTEEQREKHLHYVDKINFSDDQLEKIKAVNSEAELLVFCNINCNDCRITLAVLERMRLVNEKLVFRIVDREGRRELMKELGDSDRIPMVLLKTADSGHVIYSEYPESVRAIILDEYKQENPTILSQYRHGEFVDDIVEQLAAEIQRDR